MDTTKILIRQYLVYVFLYESHNMLRSIYEFMQISFLILIHTQLVVLCQFLCLVTNENVIGQVSLVSPVHQALGAILVRATSYQLCASYDVKTHLLENCSL